MCHNNMCHKKDLKCILIKYILNNILMFSNICNKDCWQNNFMDVSLHACVVYCIVMTETWGKKPFKWSSWQNQSLRDITFNFILDIIQLPVRLIVSHMDKWESDAISLNIENLWSLSYNDECLRSVDYLIVVIIL